MTPTIPDSNILLDIIFRRHEWFEWSSRWFDHCAEEGRLAVNAIIFAESTSRIHDLKAATQLLAQFDLDYEDMPHESAFLAGRAQQAYLKNGGMRERVLGDFLIGAHAMVRGYRVLTRDQARYRTYFPTLDIIAPDTHP